MSVAFEQQRRKCFAPLPRDWETTRKAILIARGARECADVGAEEAARDARTLAMAREAEYAMGQAQADPTDPTTWFPGAIISGGSLAELLGGVTQQQRTLVDQLYEDKYR